MLAARWHGNRDVRVEETELALELGPGMLEAEVTYCGLCGSDVAEFAHGPFAIRPDRSHPLSGQRPPLTLGHEFSGRISAIGPGVAGLAVGDRVSADACWRCGTCAACVSGNYNQCASGGSIGLCSDGALAARVRFPAYAAVALADAVSDRSGALLEPLAVGLHALERGRPASGDDVVVLGFGAIGSATAFVASAVGMGVIVSEPNPARRARAAAWGFPVHAPTGDARVDGREIRRLTGGGARCVIDATGVPSVLELAPELTRRGGTVVVVGLPKRRLALDAARLVLFERAIVGSLGYANDLPRVASLIAHGALDAERMVTSTIALDQVPEELARLADRPGDSIKVLVAIGAAT